MANEMWRRPCPTFTGLNADAGKFVGSSSPETLQLINMERSWKNPLIWIDLEMTGLNLEKDQVIEIAVIVTDG